MGEMPVSGCVIATAPSGGIVAAKPRKLTGDLDGYWLYLKSGKASRRYDHRLLIDRTPCGPPALMSGLVADKDVRWAASVGVTLRLAQWDTFFDGLAARTSSS